MYTERERRGRYVLRERGRKISKQRETERYKLPTSTVFHYNSEEKSRDGRVK